MFTVLKNDKATKQSDTYQQGLLLKCAAGYDRLTRWIIINTEDIQFFELFNSKISRCQFLLTMTRNYVKNTTEQSETRTTIKPTQTQKFQVYWDRERKFTLKSKIPPFSSYKLTRPQKEQFSLRITQSKHQQSNKIFEMKTETHSNKYEFDMYLSPTTFRNFKQVNPDMYK